MQIGKVQKFIFGAPCRRQLLLDLGSLLEDNSGNLGNLNDIITTMNMPTSIRLKCQGVESPIKFTHTVLKFSSCCPGDKITHSVFATNTTNCRQVFEFAVPKPEKSFIRISPNVETLEPGQTVRLEIE